MYACDGWTAGSIGFEFSDACKVVERGLENGRGGDSNSEDSESWSEGSETRLGGLISYVEDVDVKGIHNHDS
jgi:hypothetical protein